MSHTTPTVSTAVSKEEIAVFIKRAGFTLSQPEIDAYYEAYGYIEQMAALIRAPAPNRMSYMVEPAHMFSFPVEGTK
ncbi:MAG: hypothetical protein CFE31_07725 [Rhizobiales bacterium PAR1]|nr:MAG: hypothetical protein CFE31_07725 [Rhizobiales bacterium PAR1]